MTEGQLNLAAAFINAEVAKCNAEVAMMVSENRKRELEGLPPKYTGLEIYNCASYLHDLPALIKSASAW